MKYNFKVKNVEDTEVLTNRLAMSCQGQFSFYSMQINVTYRSRERRTWADYESIHAERLYTVHAFTSLPLPLSSSPVHVVFPCDIMGAYIY